MGDVVHLLDDSQYRVHKIIPPPTSVILKRTKHSTDRSYLRTPCRNFFSAPRMVNQSTQTEIPHPDSVNTWAPTFLQGCGLIAVEAYNRGRPFCLGEFLIDQH